MLRLYYSIKPLIPRRIQIKLRKKWIRRQAKRYNDIWPIDERAKYPPEGWSGWPEGKQFALVFTHDVETARGHEKSYRLAKFEEDLGFRSSFNFVPERYKVSSELRDYLTSHGFEVGVHGLVHDGKYFRSRRIFRERAAKINNYLSNWSAVGFRSPSMIRNLEWIQDLNIEYDSSTFDTDPFEPQPEGAGTIFPFSVHGGNLNKGYIELPYTLPQDFTLFILMEKENINIWKKKLDWIIENGGMALLNTHPDYMNMDKKNMLGDEYLVERYLELLHYVKNRYSGCYWHVLPKAVAQLWQTRNYGGNNE